MYSKEQLADILRRYEYPDFLMDKTVERLNNMQQEIKVLFDKWMINGDIPKDEINGYTFEVDIEEGDVKEHTGPISEVPLKPSGDIANENTEFVAEYGTISLHQSRHGRGRNLPRRHLVHNRRGDGQSGADGHLPQPVGAGSGGQQQNRSAVFRHLRQDAGGRFHSGDRFRRRAEIYPTFPGAGNQGSDRPVIFRRCRNR